MSTMLTLFESARTVSVPIVVIRTADQAAAVEAIRAASNEHPVVQWDAARGMTDVNDLGKTALAKAGIKADETIGFTEAILAALKLPPRSVFCVHNAHRQLTASEGLAVAPAVQAVSNIRDKFKVNFRMLVLLASDFSAPPELAHDIVIIDEELPGADVLATIVKEVHASVKDLAAPSDDVVAKAVGATIGLSNFEAEQITAMSLTENGLDLNALWERKRTTIDQVRGLSVYRGKETFDDLKGLDAVKAKLRARIHAKTPIGVVVWIDEGSDVFANVEHDTSGVKTDQQRALLVEMENNGWKGVILTGVAGSGKSALARAFGNEAGVPTIALDFGDMEAPHVGESEAFLRNAIRTIKAVGGGNAFFILTCNSLAGIRPQFMRRFKKGVYFFNEPSSAECVPIWEFYEKKLGLKKQPRPNYDGWTGAEIRECCEEAWDTGITLLEAAQSIIPVTRSRVDVIDEMKRGAHGRFLDANTPGIYRYEPETAKPALRAIMLPPKVIDAITKMDES